MIKARWLPRALLSLCVLTFPVASAAEFRLASVFSDHMVLQRDKPVRVWGEAGAGATIDVSLGAVIRSTKANPEGRWRVEFEPMKPSVEPVPLKATSAGKELLFRDVLVGDVWICSGQSNMQMTLRETDGGAALAGEAAKETRLRLLTVPRKPADKPQTTFDAKWTAASPESAATFSAVGYSFGVERLRDPAMADVPVGLIDCSFGGTAAEAWTSPDALKTLDPKDLLPSMFGIAPGHLSNAMVAPLTPMPAAGVLWYQGESNASRADVYPRVLSTMIADWRSRFEDARLPFLIVQLPAFTDPAFIWIREAQARVAKNTPHTALAVTIDTTDGFDLHPKQKREIGRRLSLLARQMAGEQVIASGPEFKAASPEGSSLRVAFDARGDGLSTRDNLPPKGFAIAGEDGAYRFADAKLDGDSVLLRNDAVPLPKTVRYAWSGIPEATLANKSGLPGAPFRTDSLPRSNLEIRPLPPSRRVVMPAYEVEITSEGKITSLVARGKQFLSNAPGPAGGTSIPVWFFHRALSDVRLLGPDLLSCADNDVTLTLTFKDEAMRWTLENRGKDDAQFRIALAAPVSMDHEKGREPTTLKRGKSSLTITGVDSVTDAEDGKVLTVLVKGGSDKSIDLAVGRAE